MSIMVKSENLLSNMVFKTLYYDEIGLRWKIEVALRSSFLIFSVLIDTDIRIEEEYVYLYKSSENKI